MGFYLIFYLNLTLNTIGINIKLRVILFYQQ